MPVAPSDDLPPQRRPLLVPVLMATVFLIVIGASVGVVMGARAQGRGVGGPGTAAPSYPAVPADGGPSGDSGALQTPRAPSTVPSSVPATASAPPSVRPATVKRITVPDDFVMPPQHDDYRGGVACPKPMAGLARQAGLKGELSLYLYVFTEYRYAVWVCAQDDNGKYFYLHQRRTREGQVVEGEPAFALADVRKQGLGYLARDVTAAGVTTYTVSAAGLIIADDDGRYEEQSPMGD